MRHPYLQSLPVLALCLLVALPVVASDKAKEARWAGQVVDQLIDGDAVWLNAGDDRFLGIVTEPDDAPRGAVLVLHGIGVHPDWPQVIYPLRVGLAERGWLTLSLQMPILPNEAEDKEYLPLLAEVTPRIEAGLAYLAERAVAPVTLVAHSMGATMASYHLRDAAAGGSITAFVAIGMSGIPNGGDGDVAESLRRIGIPILDIYGERDLDSVLSLAGKRREAAAGNAAYRQEVSPGTDHFFNDSEEVLVERVDGWLAAQTGR